jgi:glycosyltransferase involved in cell wall biosynthesis
MDLAIVATARFGIVEPFAGGLEMHTFVLADNLVRRGHTVTVYAGGSGTSPFATYEMLPIDFAPSEAARFDMSQSPQDRIGEHHSYLDAMIQLASKDHDLVHINAVHHLPFACASLLRAPVTATLHCPPTPWLESALAISARRRNPPRLASVSRANAATWTSASIERVIHNGVDLTTWRPGPGGDAAVWTGRIVPEKAPHLAIDACRRVGIPLRLWGPVHDAGYFGEAIAPRLGPDVEYLGHGTRADLAAIVATSCVAVVTPVWDEPFGLIVAEALACGTPVAALRRGALAELVADDVGALAATTDELPAAILAAASKRRSDCRHHAERCYSDVVMTDRYESWFDDAVAGGPASPHADWVEAV